MFHHSPIDNDYNLEDSVKKPIHSTSTTSDDSSSGGSTLSKRSSSLSRYSTRDEMERELFQITTLPTDLMKHVDIFIDDLKQPKYIRPLSIFQLSGLFQQFYSKFDAACIQYLNRQGGSALSSGLQDSGALVGTRETLSTGLSGIFSRSRSGSEAVQKRQASAIFGMELQGSPQTAVSAEELQKHTKTRELNSLRVDKYMDLCERDVFQKILEVGTSVPGSVKNGSSVRKVQVLDLFRNSPEFVEYDALLSEKIHNLKYLVVKEKLALPEFLGMPANLDFDSKPFGEFLISLVKNRMSPVEKIAQLLNMHDSMTELRDATSNDDYLSMLIYVIILNPVKMLYLNILFIRLFRCGRKLVASEQYVITNITAAMYFLENLSYDDLPVETKNYTTREAIFVLSDKIKLPDVKAQAKPELPRTNSYKSMVGATLDNSLRNIFGKIKSYTPPGPPQNNNIPSVHHTQKQQAQNQNQKIFQIQSPRYQHVSPVTNESLNSLNLDDNRKHRITVPRSWKKFRDRDFEELKVSELRHLFEIYQKMLETLEA